MYYLVSILLGMIPEVLYFTLFLIYTKDLKEKKIRLCLLIAIAYFLCLMINRFKLVYYIGFLFLIYLILKLLYKKKAQITDIFIISLAFLYVCIISYICFLFVKEDYSNYYLLCVINKILLFVPFSFRKKFNIWYKKYYSLWNRNDNVKRPIKSITLRNLSLIGLNIFVFINNIVFLYMLN